MVPGLLTVSIQNGLPVSDSRKRLSLLSTIENSGGATGGGNSLRFWMRKPSLNRLLVISSRALSACGVFSDFSYKSVISPISREICRASTRVTLSQWRSRITPVMIVCNSTIGATRMISARWYSPDGRCASRKRLKW